MNHSSPYQKNYIKNTTMNFKRGQDPKEAIGVGLKANAPLIGLLYKIEYKKDYNWDYTPSISERKTLNIVNSGEVIHILEGLVNGTIPLENFAFEKESEPESELVRDLKFFTEYKGKYLRYIDRTPIMVNYPMDNNIIHREYIFLIPE